MKIKGIGIDVPDARIDGDMEALRRELEFFAACGFDAVELTVAGFYLIISGRLDERRAARIVAILAQYPFSYTLHLPDELSLASADDLRMEHSIFSACLDFAAQARVSVAVYHSGLCGLAAAELKHAEERRAREIEQLRLLAQKASEHDILIAVENGDPSPAESAAVAERAMSGAEARSRRPALDPLAVAAEVEEVAHPNVGMTLDLGHFYLASALTGQEFLPTIDAVASRVDHLHLNDNFGRNPSREPSRMKQAIYGLGDCHLPPGMGSIPLREAFGLLSDFSGFIILELRPSYRLHFPEALGWVRSLINAENNSYWFRAPRPPD